jgi:hypothetical protein
VCQAPRLPSEITCKRIESRDHQTSQAIKTFFGRPSINRVKAKYSETCTFLRDASITTQSNVAQRPVAMKRSPQPTGRRLERNLPGNLHGIRRLRQYGTVRSTTTSKPLFSSWIPKWLQMSTQSNTKSVPDCSLPRSSTHHLRKLPQG